MDRPDWLEEGAEVQFTASKHSCMKSTMGRSCVAIVEDMNGGSEDCFIRAPNGESGWVSWSEVSPVGSKPEAKPLNKTQRKALAKVGKKLTKELCAWIEEAQAAGLEVGVYIATGDECDSECIVEYQPPLPPKEVY